MKGQTSASLLNQLDLLVGQAVELVDELVDLLVGRIDLTLDERLPVIGLVEYVALQDPTPCSRMPKMKSRSQIHNGTD